MSEVINTNSLDIHEIKRNLKSHLSKQATLQDYDLEGSTMAILLDIFSQVSHLNGVYANKALNETFLDTSLLRNSVVSRAKELNYFPRQYTSAVAELTINITVPVTDIRTTFVVPRGIRFITDFEGKRYNFVTMSQHILTEKTGNTFSGDIIVHEGTIIEERYTVNKDDVDQRFVVSVDKIDTRFLDVQVLQSSNSSLIEKFVNELDLTNIDATTPVYFMQENENGHVELYFGDGVIGKELLNNNVVIVEYLKSSGELSNNSTTFVLTMNVEDINKSNITVQTVQAAHGGSERESTESIKFLAPKSYVTQNRLVSLPDYKNYLLSNFGNIESISVWGGQDNVPPVFGRVFISIKPKSDKLSLLEKEEILEDISKIITTGMVVEFIDPDLIFVNVEGTVRFSKNKTTFNETHLSNLVTTAVETYFLTNVDNFDSDLVASKLSCVIDDTHESVIGNLFTITLSKKFTPINEPKTYEFYFANQLKPGGFLSATWSNGIDTFYLKDDSAGKIDLYMNNVLNKKAVGSIDYTEGAATFIAFNPSIVLNNSIELFAEPVTNDVSSLRNNILVLGNKNIVAISE